MYLPNPYFKNVSYYGDLHVEKVIVDYDELFPILFSLRDNKNNLFLCSCFDTENGQQWVLAPITPSALIDLLSDQITLSTPFKTSTNVVLIDWNHNTKVESHKVIDSVNVDPSILPVEGEYLEDGADFWLDYICDLKTEIASVSKKDIWQRPVFNCIGPCIVQLKKRELNFFRKILRLVSILKVVNSQKLIL